MPPLLAEKPMPLAAPLMVMTSELAVKWFILHDGIRTGRTDGALVRLVTPVPPNEDIARSDGRLTAFLASIEPRLRDHVPH